MSYTTPQGVPGYPMVFKNGTHLGKTFRTAQLLQKARNAGFGNNIGKYISSINAGIDFLPYPESSSNSAAAPSMHVGGPPQSSSSSAATISPPQSSSSSAATISPPQPSSSSAAPSGGPPGITHPNLKKKAVSPFLPGVVPLSYAFNSSKKGGRKTKRRKHKKATRRRR